MARHNPDIPAREQLSFHPVLHEGWLALQAIGHIAYETFDKALGTALSTTADEIDLFRLRNGDQAKVQQIIENAQPDPNIPKST
jgi:hypothetical protein